MIFVWFDDRATYRAANRAHNLRTTFYNDGFAVEPRDARRGEGQPLDDWALSFRVSSPAHPLLDFHSAQPSVQRNSARLATPQLDVNYLNSTNGLQQTFLVKEPPTAGSLTIDLTVTLNGLDMRMDEDGTSVAFHRST